MECNICRLCLKIVNGNNFEIIEQITREIMQKLLLNMKLDISKEPIICDDCADKLQKSIDFKSICYYTEEEMLLFINPDLGAPIKSNKICLRDNTTIADISEKWECCRFCKNRTERECSGFLKELKENVLIINVLEKHIPESNFTVDEDSVTCPLCYESIRNIGTFIFNCLNVEEKIEKYVEINGRDDEGQINLYNILKFTFPPTLEDNFSHSAVSKTEEINYESIENKYLSCVKTEGRENGCLLESNNEQIKSDITNLGVKTEIVDENLTEDGNMIFCSMMNIKSESFGMKSEDCESFQNMKVPNIDTGEMDAEIHSEELPMASMAQFDCNSVNTDTPHRCTMCLFETKYKKSLNRHMLTHKDLSDIKVYSCDLCPYMTKHKHNLNEHMLVHKNPSEINMFKCHLCSYEAKRKNNLTKHLVMHKDPSEISMYKCSLCTYEAKFNSDLKNHMLCHKDTSEVEMYKCQTCMFETRHKGYLKKHMRIHQLELEFKMFICDTCPFKTRHRDSFNQHTLSHKDVSEVTMFKCQVCSFQTRYKKVLTGHMVLHRDPSEIKMYKCEICPYETKRKNYLKMHALVHQDPSDIVMYQCDKCTYQTKRKIYLKQHMTTHKKSIHAQAVFGSTGQQSIDCNQQKIFKL